MTNPAPPNTYGGSVGQALQGLIYQYGSLDYVPQSVLSSMGFSSVDQAKAAAQQAGVKVYSGSTPESQVRGAFNASKAGDGSKVGNILMDIFKGANSITTGTGLPSTNKPGMPNQVYLPQPPAPGSGVNTDVTPMPGGVQYGQPGGSTLGAAHGTPAPQPFSQSTYDEQVPQGGAATTSTTATDPTSNYPGMPNYQDYINGLKLGQYVDMPTPPTPTPFKVGNFTPQASGMTATAYSPAFAAIELAKQNANTNYGNAQTAVTGIYKDLGNDITAQGNALDAKYAAAKTASQQDVSAGQRAAQQAAKAAGATLTAAAGASGAGKYAGGYNANTAGDAAAQVGNMAKMGLANTQAEGQHQLAYDTANTGLNSAAATQGAFGRQQLAYDLANTLSGYDQNKLNLTSDEALKTLDLAQQLSGQDLSLQQANAAQGTNYYQELAAAAAAKNQNIGAMNTNLINMANTAYTNNYTSAKDTRDAMMAAQVEKDLNDYRTGSLATSTNNALINASGNGSGTTKAPDAGAYGTFGTELNNLLGTSTAPADPAKVKALSDFITQRYLSYAGQGSQPNPQKFLEDTLNDPAATTAGFDPTTLMAAVSAFYGSGLAAGFPGGKTY